MDRSELFLHPVSKEEVPDYYDVIKEPMTWTQIEERLDKMMYLSTDAFKVS
jgi:NuA3 HAT complex component NTO1